MRDVKDVLMWSKLSIRIKITLLTAMVFCIILALTFVFTIENAATIFIIADEAPVPINEQTMSLNFNFDYAQQAFRLSTFYIMVFFSIAGTFLIWWVSGKVLKPMKKFSNKIKEFDISKINEDINVVKSQDEVGDLQLAFNYMLKNIRDSYEKQRRFSQYAAHELKTPVAAIRANLEVLDMDEEPSVEDYKEFKKVVSRQIEAMNSIVQGLRLLSSGDSLNLTNFYPYIAIKDILFDLDSLIKTKDLKVNIDFDNEESVISADQILMKQAIFNIIHNALRYSKEGELIEIVLKKDVLSIKNYGVGIAEDSINKIFEPFYCVDKSRSKKLGGSGLGLAITKEILKAHGFDISANSKEEEFTEFRICFN